MTVQKNSATQAIPNSTITTCTHEANHADNKKFQIVGARIF